MKQRRFGAPAKRSVVPLGMELLHVDHGGLGYRETVDLPGRTLRARVIPRSNEQVVLRDGRRRSVCEMAAVVAQGARLIIIKVACCGENRHAYLRKLLRSGFGRKIEFLIAHVIEPHVQERKFLSALVYHPPVVGGNSERGIQFAVQSCLVVLHGDQAATAALRSAGGLRLLAA